MVTLVDGTGVVQLVEKAIRNPGLYQRVIVSSPFLDDEGAELLRRLFHATKGGPAVTLLTRPEVAVRFAELVGQLHGEVNLVTAADLHAKCYVLVGRKVADSEAIVTSSNLTAAGMGRNWEVGIAIKGEPQPVIGNLSALLMGSSRRRGDKRNGYQKHGRAFVHATRVHEPRALAGYAQPVDVRRDRPPSAG